MANHDDTNNNSLYSSLFCAYTELKQICPDIDFSMYVSDGETLCSMKFGELIWLCKILEAACETYKSNYKVTNYNYADKANGNIQR